MTNEVPSSCRPDRHLTQSHLQELYDDFNASLATARPPAFIFTSLVNNVRIAYKDALNEAREELLHKSKNYTQQLAELKLERKKELEPGARACLPEVSFNHGDKTNTENEAAKPAPPYDSGQAWQPSTDTFTLYITSSPTHHRRDWLAWDNGEDGDWKLRMNLKVFRFQEPGTVRIYAMRKNAPARLLVVRDLSYLSAGWKSELEFWAYDRPRPRTQRIWSGFQEGPDRSILVKGSREGMEEWEEKCEFWVPV